jgi:hypothetical protein
MAIVRHLPNEKGSMSVIACSRQVVDHSYCCVNFHHWSRLGKVFWNEERRCFDCTVSCFRKQNQTNSDSMSTGATEVRATTPGYLSHVRASDIVVRRGRHERNVGVSFFGTPVPRTFHGI